MKLKNRKDGRIVCEINQVRTSIGRDSSNDIVLDDDLVSGFHANLFYENGSLVCVDLGSANGTYVNDKRITMRTSLDDRDILKLGDTELEVFDENTSRLTVVQPAVDKVAEKRDKNQGKAVAVLRLLSTGAHPRECSIGDEVVVGRSPENDLVLNLGTVSSRHARIVNTPLGLEITDLGSSNGTYVNGRKVREQILRHADVVRFDEVEYRVEMADSGIDKTTLRPAIDEAAATVLRQVPMKEDRGNVLRTSGGDPFQADGRTIREAHGESSLQASPAEGSRGEASKFESEQADDVLKEKEKWKADCPPLEPRKETMSESTGGVSGKAKGGRMPLGKHCSHLRGG